MSDPLAATPGDLPAVELVGEGRLATVERFFERLGERLNPILVKETRQALKSRQFVVTFALLLICCWTWSIFGLWVMGPEVAYGAQGSQMLLGYYVILAFPLLVVVPFGAFRSLASEQEERTYELLWITTLRPRQIISGKLASAGVQMLLYLSAISPCLAFTYLLRGVSLPAIFFLLVYTVLVSLGLSLIGLFVGTLSTEKHFQVILSVLLILGLLTAFWLSCLMAGEGVLATDIPFITPEFWKVMAAILTIYGSYFALLFVAAVARTTFASDNRSTAIRVVLMLQHVLLAGLIAWITLDTSVYDGDMLYGFAIPISLHWYITGALMTGESPELSLRVRRKLPMSTLGRMFLTWFNPGPATGYVFAVGGMMAAAVTVILAGAVWNLLKASIPQSNLEGCVLFAVLALCYLTFYLGLGLLLISLLRRVGRTSMLLSVLLQIMLVLLGCGVPLVIQTTSSYWGQTGYSLLQISNPFWTLAEIVDRNNVIPQASLLLVILPVMALGVFTLNLPAIARELRYVRLAKPARVAEEDAELAARYAPTEPTRLSPWDD